MAYRAEKFSHYLIYRSKQLLPHTVQRVAHRSVSVLASPERWVRAGPNARSTTFQRRQETTGVASDEATFSERKRKERFIPIARRTLIQSMMNEENFLSGKERACLEAFATSLDAVIAQRYYRLMEEVKVR